jgi:outer membrane protein OmpA-like peptidoglycan-associated protein
MKKLLFLAVLLAVMSRADSQILKKVFDRTKQKTEEKAAEKVSEKVSDAATKPIDDAGKKNTDKNNKNNNSGNNTGDNKDITENNADVVTGEVKEKNTIPTLATYSKFDFVPGEKILSTEDFSQDAIGDFPAKWNTNGSGEVVTVDGQQGHWLMINKKGRFIPEYITNLPENFTFQFDVICNEKFNFYSNALQVFFLTGTNDKKALEYSFIPLEKRSGIKVGVHPANAGSTGGTAYVNTFEDGEPVINNEVNTTRFNSNTGKTKVKVSIWRQKQRVRVYLNEEKVFDLPRAFATGKNYSTVLFELWSGMHNDLDRYLISNIELAVGAPDTRNKLITEGKYVTRGILFDVNSDKIKPESYGVLKDIAAVLNENPGVKVKIVGHTDADGKDADNLTLSKNRAASVKDALMNEFKIDAARMETDGKGESQPVDKNDTSAGKANNRRVEFIKQ